MSFEYNFWFGIGQAIVFTPDISIFTEAAIYSSTSEERNSFKANMQREKWPLDGQNRKPS